MKILHVLYAGMGGHGNVFFSFVKADKDKQFQYEALFYGIEEVRPGFIDSCIAHKIPWYFAKKKQGIDLRYYLHIFRLIRKSNPDIIFLHGSAYILPARFAALLSGKKVKVIVRETQANHLKTRGQWVSLVGSMLMASRIVCLTDEFREQIHRKIKFLFRDRKVMVISNGIDMDVYYPGTTENNLDILIGMQGRLVRIKDHTTLLKAFASLLKRKPEWPRSLKLQIAGDGDFKEALMQLTEELGIGGNVEFTGMLDEQDLVNYLQRLDIYVHASLGETMSTAIMQAMACKLPIIASDVQGINNMIRNGVTGILVPPQNETEMEKALYNCLVNADLRRAIAQNAYAYAQTCFSNQKMMESYKNLFL